MQRSTSEAENAQPRGGQKIEEEEREEPQEPYEVPAWGRPFLGAAKQAQCRRIGLSQRQLRALLRAELAVFVVTLVLFLAWYALSLWRIGRTVWGSQIFSAFFWAPFAAYWRYTASKLNYRGPRALGWFPSGTYLVNTLACLINFCLIVALQTRLVERQERFENLVLSVENGFTGTLSTVSTWVAEI